MARRKLTGLLIGATCTAALATSACSDAEAERPNILLISVDTLRPDFLGCYGHPRDTSPTLDKIAAAGTIFTDVTAASPWTLPSHASLLTGLYPSSHGVKDHDQQLTKETLATRLLKAGYETMAVVNSHNIGDKRYGLLRGFERAHYQDEKKIEPGKTLITNQGPKLTREALRFLKDRDETRPFFLFVHYYDVHTDFTPDQEWRDHFVEPYDGELDGNTLQLVDYRHNGQVLSPADIKWLEQMYEAEIRTFDGVVKRIFDYLDMAGLSENTLVMITADHGEEYWEHESVLHGRTYYQEVIRIPLIVRGPGIPVGAKIDTPVHLIDVAPTIYSLVAVHPSAMLDGVDLSPALGRNGTVESNRFLFAEADHNNRFEGKDVSDIRRMIRIGNEKLCYDTLTGKKELYDLSVDPGEQNDLSAARPERVEELFAELTRFMERETDPGSNPLEEMNADTAADLQRLGY